MSPPGRPKGEFLSAQREGSPISPPGRPKGEFLSAQREGSPMGGLPGGPPLPVQTFLAFDYGVKRTGVATGNSVTRTAQPLTTIHAEGEARFPAIDRLIREWAPQALVVGVPFHPDGAEHENTRRARRFVRQLQGRFGLPVHEVDERYSTVEVLAYGARDADAAAAALLLEQHFSAESMATAVAGQS